MTAESPLTWLQRLPWIDVGFGRPSVLWALALVPMLVIAFALDGQRRRRVLERIGNLPQIRRLTASVSLPRRRLKVTMLVLACGLLVIAAARPQRPGQARMLPRRGLDIVVALDFSRSMRASDIYPSRLDRAKRELDKLIDGLKGDRVGLVAFAGVTLSYPLTSDYSAAKLFWRDLQPEDIPVGGTDLGGAVRAALELLAHAQEHRTDRRKPAQLIVLLTDGADTEGGALEAARVAAQQGVKIFPVGIGSRAGEVVVLRRLSDGSAEYVTDASGKPVRMELDEPTLKQLASATSGTYFPFDAERFGVEQVQQAIAGLERTEEEGRVVREPDEAYGVLAAVALALLVLELLLSDRKPRVAVLDPLLAATMESGPAPRRKARLGERRSGRPGATAALLLLLLPWLGGWSWFERPSPDVSEGNRKLAAGKPGEALSAYERALAQRPDDPAIHYDRGAALYALGRLPEALREFERATESSDPKLRADAWYNAGNARLKQERLPDAIDAYKRALRLRPEDRRAKWNLELALRRQQEQQKQQQQEQQQEQQQQQQRESAQQDAQKPQAGKPQPPPPSGDKARPEAGKRADGKPDNAPSKGPEDEQQPSEAEQARREHEKAQRASAERKHLDAHQQDLSEGGEKPRTAEAAPPPEKPPEPKPVDKAATGVARAAREAPRDIDKQDAEAVLDAFERVEPTVQKDLARRRAGSRRPRKDW